jgi:hypothetical protein
VMSSRDRFDIGFLLIVTLILTVAAVQPWR